MSAFEVGDRVETINAPVGEGSVVEVNGEILRIQMDDERFPKPLTFGSPAVRRLP